ncbi:tripartite tricarboxylate transporter substrate-binding protein [Aquabacterium sp.]|uniref:tripartite tricarboxylate transporter substrate-binding protein n=1 Tax=Aquabacterium sp. TaxID=1872578 RepID=UPI002C3B0CD5|nr:tripartite tricarboxylate transporter substrate-binding protein [Aquabacterium sp.]HSW07286.1 tripartite tricarboxylate transporter substrate-binding protein [Aquabacterium sp.]
MTTTIFRRPAAAWLVFLLVALGVFTLPVSAQTPASAAGVPLRLVVGFAPGGALDMLARAVAEQLRAGGEGQVLVENKPGASSRISIDYVRTSQANGRTVLLSSNAPLILFPMTYRSLSYDVDRDFIPVAHLVEVPTVVSTGADQPFRSLPDYITWLRAHPAQANVGLTSLGGALHFAVIGMGRELGLPLTPIPYKGGAPLVTDLVGGQVPLSTDALASQLELHRSGKVRILAVSGLTRNAALPEVPTVHEAGIKAFDHANAAYGAYVPTGTPPEVVRKLEAALIAAMRTPQVKEAMSRAGMGATGLPGKDLRRILDDERRFWRPIVQASGFRSED